MREFRELQVPRMVSAGISLCADLKLVVWHRAKTKFRTLHALADSGPANIHHQLKVRTL